MKFELASLLSLLLVASSVNAGHRKHNKGGPQPSADETVETGETDGQTSAHDEAPPNIKGPQRILKNPGIVRCWLDDYNQTLAILEMSNYAVNPKNTKPHYPYAANDGKVKYTVKFDNGVKGLDVHMIQTWNLDRPYIFPDGKSFSFEEIDGGVNPGGTFMFLGARSCYNGTIKPAVHVQISAALNGNQPIHVGIQNE
jgi:hypothetical protein